MRILASHKLNPFFLPLLLIAAAGPTPGCGEPSTPSPAAVQRLVDLRSEMKFQQPFDPTDPGAVLSHVGMDRWVNPLESLDGFHVALAGDALRAMKKTGDPKTSSLRPVERQGGKSWRIAAPAIVWSRVPQRESGDVRFQLDLKANEQTKYPIH